MKSLLVIAAAASLLAGCATCPQRTTAWEYKTISGSVSLNGSRLDAAINRETSEGWQFVTAGQASDHWGFAVMRRPKK